MAEQLAEMLAKKLAEKPEEKLEEKLGSATVLIMFLQRSANVSYFEP